MNEADVQAVFRHLVDEERCGALAHTARALEIALAERAQLRAAEARHRLEEARARFRSAALGQLARDLRHIRQLHGPLDARVARRGLVRQAWSPRAGGG